MSVFGLIGGTGLDHWGEGQELAPVGTPFGEPSGFITRFQAGPHEILFLPRHGAGHNIPPHCINYRANLWALREAGAGAVIAVNAVGGIDSRFPPPALVLPDQLIDYTWGREHTISDSPSVPLTHIEFGTPFDEGLRFALQKAGRAAGLEVGVDACIGVTQGPRLETAAEIRRLQHDGCDLVGMTSMPEASLAVEFEIPYAAVAVVANWGAGLDEVPISMGSIDAMLARGMGDLRSLLTAFFSEG